MSLTLLAGREFSAAWALTAAVLLLGMGGVARRAAGQAPEGYSLAWSDDFDGTALETSKWGYHSIGKRRDAVNIREAAKLDGEGHLVISTNKVMVDGKAQYQTAMIETRGKYERRFGYWEARIKLQRQEGHWSAFWLMPTTMGKPVGNTAEGGAEIDIMEYHSKWMDGVLHTLHWDGYGEDHKSTNKKVTVEGLHAGYHTFGLLWTAEKYVFYVDGKATWETTAAISQRPQYAILSLEVGTWAGEIGKAELPDSMVVDYVRHYEKKAEGAK